MKLRQIIIIAFSLMFWLGGLLMSPNAEAMTQIQLSDISYQDCPEEYEGGLLSGSSNAASCFLITGTAKNPSGKTIYDADVFGRIYDANGNPVLQNRTRVGSITEVPPGVSEFSLRISVPANQPTPLQLEQFKASGFSSSVSPRVRF
ncbi:MAG: FxLYD domain-containing protein [Halothece sp. Uz-M2-17]|nr:FxLYD domain-containing protein [Halothece sp. Uz-M2-17]